MAEPDFVDFLRGMRVAQGAQERKERQRGGRVVRAASAEWLTAMRALNVAVEPDVSRPWGAWDEVRMFAMDFMHLMVTWDRLYVWSRHKRFLT